MVTARLSAALLALILWALAATSVSAQTRFVQITDPHLFDTDRQLDEPLDSSEKELRRTDTERAFVAALSAIDEQIERGSNYQFVVITGDLGVAHWHGEPSAAAARMAGWLRVSKAPRFLFVPGNNDVGNRYEHEEKYQQFIAALKGELGERVVDIVAEPLAVGDMLFVGHNNATYRFERERQLPEVNALRTRIEKAAAKHIYLFVHIPEIDDPHLIENNTPDHTLAYPYSAWGVSRAVRQTWHAIIGDARVKAVFTGHFHSGVRRYYQRPFRWLRSRYPAAVMAKTHLCPPISAKYQWEIAERARGFQVITIGAQGRADTRVYWYRDGRFLTAQTRRARAAR